MIAPGRIPPWPPRTWSRPEQRLETWLVSLTSGSSSWEQGKNITDYYTGMDYFVLVVVIDVRSPHNIVCLFCFC